MNRMKTVLVIVVLVVAAVLLPAACKNAEKTTKPTDKPTETSKGESRNMTSETSKDLISETQTDKDATPTDTEATSEPEVFPQPTYTVAVSIGSRTLYIEMSENSSAEAFVEKLKEAPLVMEMQDYGNFEKVGDLPWSLPTNDERITTEPGDLILYQGNKLTIYYDENTWEFTRLGRIYNISQDELKALLGKGDVSAEFYLEWTE